MFSRGFGNALALYHLLTTQKNVSLCHEVYDLWFFSSNNLSYAPVTRVEAFLKKWLRNREDI
jgi:hypothetical protein